MKIKELMAKSVHTCRPEDTLEQAAGTMLKEDIGALAVVDSDNKLVGMITDRDICMSSLIEGRSLKELPVSQAATKPAIACKLEDPLTTVQSAMQTHQLHRIPVIDKQQKLVGIVGLGDVARATNDKKSGITPADLSQTLAAILKPRAQAAATSTAQRS